MNEIVVSGDKEKDSRDTLIPPTTAVYYSIERDYVKFEKIGGAAAQARKLYAPYQVASWTLRIVFIASH